MAVGATVAFLVLILIAVGAGTLALAARHRLAFRIAMRNVRRGRVRTALLIAGLLVATTIVSGSLVVGDTVQQLAYHYTYIGAGYDDEAISGDSPAGGPLYYPYSVYTEVASQLSGDPSITGVTPEILDSAAVYDRATGIPETALNLIGVNGNQSTALGSFVADNGTTIAGPLPGEALIDDQTAQAIDARVGDPIVVFGLAAVPLTVQAVVQENDRGGFITAGLTPGNVFVSLATAQLLEQAPGRINYLSITNTGSQAAGAADSSTVSASLNVTLAAVLSTYGLTVKTPLETALVQASQSAQTLLTLFLVLGLFSIVAGALLIVGIFVMLAEERKGEMGMLRAIGMRRRELVYTYYFEGVAYSSGSALAGTAAGVGVGYLLVYLAGFILSGEGIPESAIVQSFTITGQSMVTAYVVGFLLTLVTVTAASYRASRLNIVRAIRDVPEPPPTRRTYTFLAYLGALLFVLGLLAFRATYQGTTDMSDPILAGAMVILGAGLVSARFLRNRPVFTVVGAALAVWAGWVPLHTYLLGDHHSGTIFIVFVEGILMVGGTLMIVLFNAPFLAGLLRRLLGAKGQSSPVIRIGLDYPTRQVTRTAVSLTIFSLVVFTMVATAAFGSTVQGNLNNEVADQSGGYSFFGESQVPLPDLWADLQANATLAPQFVNAVPLVTGAVGVSVPGYASNPYRDSLFAAPTGGPGPADFYTTNQFDFASTLGGISASAVFQELATDPGVAVVDNTYAPPTTTLTGAGPSTPHPTLSVGTSIGVQRLGTPRSVNVTVIGILKESAVSGVWLNPMAAASIGYTNRTAYFLTAAPGVDTGHAAQDMKRAFFSAGLVLFDIRALLATSINTIEGFIGLLEIFVGLGLGVGIAAMGILALRAVVERRRQIGMLRATGFTQGMVLRAYILEYSVVTLVGVAIGVVLGVLIVYNLTTSPSLATDGITNFVAPWATIAEIAIITYALVLAAIAGPAGRAAPAGRGGPRGRVGRVRARIRRSGASTPARPRAASPCVVASGRTEGRRGAGTRRRARTRRSRAPTMGSPRRSSRSRAGGGAPARSSP
jgi:putative ABC transport system permease protein